MKKSAILFSLFAAIVFLSSCGSSKSPQIVTFQDSAGNIDSVFVREWYSLDETAIAGEAILIEYYTFNVGNYRTYTEGPTTMKVTNDTIQTIEPDGIVWQEKVTVISMRDAPKSEEMTERYKRSLEAYSVKNGGRAKAM